MGRPKQFIELRGEPALVHTLRAFEKVEEISRIYTVGDGGEIPALARRAGVGKFAGCASPGSSRSRSALNGIRLIDAPPDTLVLIHDGSRCLVSPALIRRVVEASPRTDCVIPALPVSDTVKVVEEDRVVKTLDRSELYAVQTPQAFRLSMLRRIYEHHAGVLDVATDDASLVELEGGVVRVVKGEKTNLKLTSPEDLILAEAILKAKGSE